MTIDRVLTLCIAGVLFIAWLVCWFSHVMSLIYGKWLLHRAPQDLSPEDMQGVSIIKPLTGVDPNLKTNLTTFFNSSYPAFEILFSVQDEQDPAILLVKSLMEAYPKVDAKLFIGIKSVGANGKVNNMVKAYEAAKYDIVLVSDSGIRMQESTLTGMMACMTSKVGMVLQMPYVADREGFAAVYEKVYFGTMQARNCLAANALGINCSTGMSCLMRKDILDAAGGMASFGKYLAEDFFFAEAFRQRGYKVVLCPEPALQNLGTYSIGEFHRRLIRWCHLRISMLPTLILLEPISECMIIGVCASFAIQHLFDISASVVFLLHILCWFLLDYTLITTVENGPLKFSKFEFLVAWLMREMLVVYVFIQCHRTRTITWRNKVYRLRWGGLAEEIKSEVV
ncbi:ceramide glucosyltransferase-like [Haliotis rufescens]|uniref:ceramide glucosyltransferase-like n=1 Tax=Haliotis rufescens TaxID=6454 RepID=UPI001EB09735|nr:ceramide glucosyltransferase-like [Haliotis rufescens]